MMISMENISKNKEWRTRSEEQEGVSFHFPFEDQTECLHWGLQGAVLTPASDKKN